MIAPSVCERGAACFWEQTLAGVDHEREIRRDERRLLARALTKSLSARHHEELYLVLRDNPEARRRAGLLVDVLCQVLAASLEETT